MWFNGACGSAAWNAGGLGDGWIAGLMDWWIGGLVDWWMAGLNEF